MRRSIFSAIILMLLLMITQRVFATDPTIICPANIISCSGNSISIGWNEPQINNPDNVTIIKLEQIGGPSPGSQFTPGTTTIITYQLTYACFIFPATFSCQTTCSFTVTVTIPTIFYRDFDWDGFGDPNPNNSIAICTTAPTGYVTNILDCNDSNADINPNTEWVLDADNDNYYIGDPITQCTSPGTGYRIKGNLQADDCDDTDPNLHGLFLFYRDSDGDGYGISSPKSDKMICAIDANTPPAGFSTNNTDCNDANPDVWRNAILYIDYDGDGYDNGQEEVCYGENIPQHYSATTLGADCDDNDVTLHGLFLFYRDNDGDGYGTSSPKSDKMICAIDANTPPAGFSTNNTDCNDSDPNIHSPQTFYRDVDSDGYGSSSNTTRLCQLTPPSGYSALGGDCNDNDPTVNPGAVEVCGNGKDDNCNGQLDEESCFKCKNASSQSTTNITSTSAVFNWVSVTNPEQWQIQYKSTAPGAKWIDVILPGNKRSYPVTGLVANQSYIWHIRGKCKTWTDYSGSIQFTTTGANILVVGKAETSEIKATQHLLVMAMPNPSSTSFRVNIKSSNQSDVIKMFVADIYGRIIEEKILTSAQTISLGDKYRPGVYIVKFMQGSENKQLRLIKLPE